MIHTPQDTPRPGGQKSRAPPLARPPTTGVHTPGTTHSDEVRAMEFSEEEYVQQIIGKQSPAGGGRRHRWNPDTLTIECVGEGERDKDDLNFAKQALGYAVSGEANNP